jgi:chemotaxis protein CheD
MPRTVHPQDRILGPGGFYFGSGEYRVRTLLGSCVAITLWHPLTRVGGMCHFLLPSRSSAELLGERPLDGRFADEAMEMFRREMQRVATSPGEYQTKIFGGGRQFADPAAGGGIDVPARNIAAAISLCQAHGLTVSSRHLGLDGSRQIVLDLANGDVWVRHSASAVQEETR